MYRQVTELLFHPDVFFLKRTVEPISLRIPAAVVGMGGVLSLVAPYVTSMSDPRSPRVLTTPESAVLFLLLLFVAWFCIAGILFTASRVLGGSGTFVATLQNAGYGCFPLTILSLAGIMNGYFTNPFSDTPAAVLNAGIIWLGFMVLLFVFWAGWLWCTAMKYTHAMSGNRAVITAMAAVLAYLLPVLLNIIALLALFSRS